MSIGNNSSIQKYRSNVIENCMLLVRCLILCLFNSAEKSQSLVIAINIKNSTYLLKVNCELTEKLLSTLFNSNVMTAMVLLV